MRWIGYAVGVLAAWTTLALLVARWVAVAAGPRSATERERDDAEQAAALDAIAAQRSPGVLDGDELSPLAAASAACDDVHDQRVSVDRPE